MGDTDSLGWRINEHWPGKWASQFADLHVTQENCAYTLAEGSLLGQGYDVKVMVKEFLEPSGVQNEIDAFRYFGGGDIATMFDAISYFDESVSMEVTLLLLEGGSGTLRQLIDKQIPLGLGTVTQLMLEMLRGLDKIHKEGFVHGALDPNSIIITGDCESEDGCHAKIGELGSLWRPAYPGAKAHEAGGIFGCAPPETYFEGASFKGDVWSLGMIFYELLFGGPPLELCLYDFTDPIQFAYKVKTEFDITRDPDMERFQEFHPDVAQIVGNMLVPDTSQRWELRRCLKKAEKLRARSQRWLND